jgi:hypothetical protein
MRASVRATRTEPRAIEITRSLRADAGPASSMGHTTTALTPSKGRLIRCTVPGSTPKRFAMTRTQVCQESPEPRGSVLDYTSIPTVSGLQPKLRH